MTGIALAQTVPYKASFRHFSSPSVPTEETFGSFKATRHLSLGFLSDSIFPIVPSHSPYGGHRVGAAEYLLIGFSSAFITASSALRTPSQRREVR